MNVNKEGTDQSATLCSLISDFVIHSLKSLISTLNTCTCQILIFHLVAVYSQEQAVSALPGRKHRRQKLNEVGVTYLNTDLLAQLAM